MVLIVTDDENVKINVERTLYTTPSVWNMDLAVFSRCNYGDRQILGVHLAANQSIKARVITSENNINVNFFNNDSYSVIENEVLTLVVPLTDMPYMTNYYKNGFKSLDLFLEYYQKVVEKMDAYVGLDFNPEKITDQNVRTKYLVKANVHGVGAAYYAGDHVGVNNASMRSFFEMNWGGLHELAHGYQGSLGKGEMLLGEVANNILGHYIQIDKNIYFHQGDWLGSLPSIEENRNEQRLSGKTFLEVDEPTRLYVIINLFNTFEGGTTYAKMFSWYREQLNLGRTMTNQDAYVESIADIYNINIIPYMEDWGLNISDSTKSKVYQNNYPLINILKDFVQEDNYLKMQVLGYNFDTIAYQLTFKNNYSKAKISYPNQSSMSGNEYIKIYNSEGTLITEDVSTGGYFDFNKGSHEIEIDVGYVIEVKYPNKYNNKVKVFSTLTGNLLSEYNATDTITRYVVIDNGLIREDMSEDTANEIAYEQIKPSLIAIIENYKSKVSDEELNNKFINFKEKNEVIDAYTKLKEKDQIPYTTLITAIKRGGSPIVKVKFENLEYKVGEELDLYSLITAIDNEDGDILINKSNTVIETTLDFQIAGTYDVIYQVSDSDNNITAKTLQIKLIDDQIPDEEPELPNEDQGKTEDEDKTITDGDDNNQTLVNTPIPPDKALDKDINKNVNSIQISETIPNSSNNKPEEDNNQDLDTVISDNSNQNNNNFVEEEKILPNEIEEENHGPNKIDLSTISEESSHLIIQIVMLLLASATCLFIVIKKIRQHDSK